MKLCPPKPGSTVMMSTWGRGLGMQMVKRRHHRSGRAGQWLARWAGRRKRPGRMQRSTAPRRGFTRCRMAGRPGGQLPHNKARCYGRAPHHVQRWHVGQQQLHRRAGLDGQPSQHARRLRSAGLQGAWRCKRACHGEAEPAEPEEKQQEPSPPAAPHLDGRNQVVHSGQPRVARRLQRRQRCRGVVASGGCLQVESVHAGAGRRKVFHPLQQGSRGRRVC